MSPEYGELDLSFLVGYEPDDETPYYCVVCGHACLRFDDFVIHDPIPHPLLFLVTDWEDHPQ